MAHGDHGPVLQHRGHQAGQHGGVDGGDHGFRVPPEGVQLVRVQFQQGNHQTLRHASGETSLNNNKQQ